MRQLNLNGRPMRLTMAIGCALACVMSGCKEAQTEQAVAEYAMLTVTAADKVLNDCQTLYKLYLSKGGTPFENAQE